MLNKKLKAVLAVMLFIPTVVLSEDGSTIGHNREGAYSTAEQIADINERMAVLSAELAELEVKAKIALKRAELNNAINPNASADSESLPSVDYINGVDGNMKASLFIQGGHTQFVGVGDKVGAWRVKQIKTDSVVLQKGKEVVNLGFGTYSAPETLNTPLPNFPSTVTR